MNYFLEENDEEVWGSTPAALGGASAAPPGGRQGALRASRAS